MIKGIGIDVVERARFTDLRGNEEFIRQVLTPEEERRAGLSKQPENFLGTAFAVKEAIIKALGCGLNPGWFWHNVELTGQAGVRLSGSYETAATALAVKEIHYTHSDTLRYIVAVAVLEG